MQSSGYTELTYWKFPPFPPPDQYGNILIDRVSSESGVKSATFSHWSHRIHYTCRVCHTELGFRLKLNETVITETANKSGQYCGACHDGTIAFGHTEEHCDKCHNGNIEYGKEKFSSLSRLPSAAYGNSVDWVGAIEERVITPATYLKDDSETIKSRKKLTITAKWSYVYSDVKFSHEIHGKWLGCTNCHTEIFDYELKKTDGLTMLNNLKNEFCGVCHGKVSFPLKDCRRCHPTIRF